LNKYTEEFGFQNYLLSTKWPEQTGEEA